MSAGQWVGAIVGAVAGFFTGGATWYATAASMAAGASAGMAVGGMIDPPMGPAIIGPRLGDLSVQSASYGAVIPRMYGTTAMAGNIFWVENNALKEVATESTQGGKGGGGSEVTTFSYYSTFALGLCEGPIFGIRRIWCSGTLIYDAGSTDLETVMASSQLAPGIRLHLGTDTQDADSRMQATLGVDNTPAFRGLAYIVFDDFALANYGNSLLGAQFKVEVVQSATLSSEIVSQTAHAVASSYARLGAVAIKGRSYSTRWVSGIFLPDILVHEVAEDGTLRSVLAYPGGPSTVQALFTDVSLDRLAFAFGQNTFGADPATLFYSADIGGQIKSLSLTRPYDMWFSVSEVDGVMVGLTWGAELSAQASSRRVYKPDGSFVAVPYTVTNDAIIRTTGEEDHFYIFQNTGRVIEYDNGGWTDSTVALPPGALAPIRDAYYSNGYLFRVFRQSAAVSGVAVCAYDVIDAASLSVVDTGLISASIVGSVSWPYLFHLDGSLVGLTGPCDPPSQYNVTGGYYATSVVDKITPGAIQLSGIIESECALAGLAASDIETTTLTDEVYGYRIAAVAAVRSNIDPLQGAFPFDIVQSGYKVKFKRRGITGSVLTIPEIDLAARDGNKTIARLTRSREMDTQLPASVTLSYIDVDREYDANTQTAERLSGATVNTRSIEMPIAMTATEAAQKTEILLYLYWSERDSFAFYVPPSYASIEPGDVVTVEAGGASYALRLVDVNRQSNGVIACQARPEASYLSTVTADTGSTTSAAVQTAGSTSIELLDVPAMGDINTTAGYVLALGRYRSGWPGGAAYRSKDSGASWSLVDTMTVPSGIGFAGSIIGAPASFGLIDSANRLTVTMHMTSLSSISELQMLNGANHFAYGVDGRWEIIAAMTCALQVDGSYILSDLLRGRFGTEGNATLHAKGDRLVLLDKSSLLFISGSLNDVGVTALYRAQTIGVDDVDTLRRSFTYRARNLLPLAPVYLNGSRDPATNDWSLSWIRRTRIGGEWRDLVDSTLGETSEAYEVEIYSSVAYTAPIRTISGLTAAATSYTSAQQVADFGSNQATLYVKIYQMSAEIGRGTPLVTSISR